MSSKNGLLVMHYGTPATLDDVEAYYTHIRHGHPPAKAQLDDLVERYQAIGGPSPLTKISAAQAELIREGAAEAGFDAKLYIGAKHTNPFIADVVEEMAADGIERAIGVVLAPHFSTFSIKAYTDYAVQARDRIGSAMSISVLQRWGTLPEFLAGLASRVQAQLHGLDLAETTIVFSAHSLPEKIMATGDPYKSELLETSRIVAEELGLPHWTFCFQSAGQTGDPWLGPDIVDVLDELAVDGRTKNVVSCTVGFISDHLEVLYDLGIEAKDKAASLGLNFRVCDVINADPVVMKALGRHAVQTLITDR